MQQITGYIDNPLFIKWIYEPDDDLNAYWSFYLENHPEERVLISSLREELGSFRFVGRQLSKEQKALLAEHIFAQIRKKQKIRNIRKISHDFLKYAAMAVLFFCLGGLIVYFNNSGKSKDPGDQFAEMPFAVRNPTLVFPDGNIADLGENDPEADYSKRNKVILNRDSIIPSSKSLIKNKTLQNQLLVPFGTRARLVLNDRTVVWLNAGSRLIYPSVFNGPERIVTLVGEGFFEVAKNEALPFVVQTSAYRIRVLGTRFNVSAYPGDLITQTVLVEGSIQMTVEQKHWFDRKITLRPHELFWFDKASKAADVKKVDPEKYMQWKEGILQFENDELNQVVHKLERYYNITIELKEPAEGYRKLNGKLNLKGDISEVLHYICRVAHMNYEKINEKHYIIE